MVTLIDNGGKFFLVEDKNITLLESTKVCPSATSFGGEGPLFPPGTLGLLQPIPSGCHSTSAQRGIFLLPDGQEYY